ncbi:MAG: hypothetical protein QGH60_07780 [Phycisphaerae bacterium]|nr:hypothetical protein [Phycisphaerae bacterium]
MNKLKRYTIMCMILVLVGVLAFGGASAFGGSRSDKISKNAPTIESSQPWLAAIYSVVALAGICVIAFKGPRRTHAG